MVETKEENCECGVEGSTEIRAVHEVMGPLACCVTREGRRKCKEK
jgi:hypothetical protein